MGGLAPPRPLLAVPNVTAHPAAASVPINVLLYDCPLLCGFNVAIKRLSLNILHTIHTEYIKHDVATHAPPSWLISDV